ncbi:hypothetical protein [Cognatiyoonia sp. IB215182]|uniref:hypothetical protein n=1 Tax=Cognatiyoonia sp. IB215182 TaxID=3097353 RepID=UPI002A164D48|nr:hypothetical protein [Cognatiyoonia sp. IB215182]MDX8353443.1 hypothetical protein [Cognatiyoonia sp. IB215182]
MFWQKTASISDDLKDWIIDSFDWADSTFGVEWRSTRQLVTPTAQFFTAKSGQTPEVAQQIANDIARLLPLEQIEVQPIANLAAEHRHNYHDLASIGGTYLHDDTAPLITYDSDLMATPIAFINTMTHELMHARVAHHIDTMPGGEPVHELSTDLHCITHGLGLFALDGPAQIGWSGYMTQESRAYALAVFLDRHGVDPTEALNRLSSRSAKALKRAITEHAADQTGS